MQTDLIRLEFQDEFEMQTKAIEPGQTVIIVDDLIATGALFLHRATMTDVSGGGTLMCENKIIGGSAAAAGDLVSKQGGNLLEYLFIAEITPLKGRDKLHAPIYSIAQIDGTEKSNLN